MSKDKHRSLDRRLKLLKDASFTYKDINFGILCHAEGGMAMNNPDLQRLKREGLIEFKRMDYSGKSIPSKRFGRFWKEIHGQSMINKVVRTRAVITEKGKRFLASFESNCK